MKNAAISNKTGPKDGPIEILHVPKNLYLKGSSGQQWFKVTNLPALFEILEKFTSSRMAYRLVAGNTGAGPLHAIFCFLHLVRLTNLG